MDIQAALQRQYHSALAMLREPLAACPAELWEHPTPAWPFWYVGWHTLFYTHLYLSADEASFVPWRARPAETDAARPREELLAYWQFVDELVDPAVAGLDLSAPECGFWWYHQTKLEHQINNLRHVQHHAAQLRDVVRGHATYTETWI
ncbi:MAG: DinB family protein [Fimbriimonadaceae bacterium]|nr:DinB family protein [Fimbriimonadaceae bacterium]